MGGMAPDWAKDVRIDDLQNPTIRDLAEVVGVETAVEIVATYSGMVIYIPKLDSVYRAMRDRKIKEEYDGNNARQLAKRHNVSESWVRRLVGGRLDGQLDMFDFVDERQAL